MPSTLTVLNNLDGPGATAGSAAPGSLRAEIAAAQSGDTIVFDPSLGGETIALTLGELVLARSVSIQGPAASHVAISGGVARAFEVDGATTNVTLGNLWVVNSQGNAAANPYAAGSNPFDGYGGGVLNFGTLTVSGCTLSGNRATSAGGGIYNQGTLTVSNSSLSNNKASNGGGICNGGFLSSSASTLTVSACTLIADSADNGGGIYNGLLGTAAVTGSSLSHNGATSAGGGIWNNGTLMVSQTTLSGNSAGSKGGGLYNARSGKLTVSSSTVLNNLAPLGADLYNLGQVKVYGSTIGVSAP